MKFSEEALDILPRVSCAEDVSYVTEIPGGLRVLCPCRKLSGRGDVVSLPTITLEFRAADRNVIEVTASHFLGCESREARCPLARRTPEYTVSVGETEAVLTVGSLSVRIDRGSFGYAFLAEGETLTACGRGDLSYVRSRKPVWTTVPGEQYLDDGWEPYMVTGLGAAPGEYFYGFGEKFTPFVKNGQSIRTWNEDGGTSSHVSYKCVPFYTSNRGYGVFVDSTDNVEFEVCSEKVETVSFSVPGEALRYFFFYGPTPAEITERYTALTGRPALPPAWSFGLWLSTSWLTNYDETTVASILDGMRERDLPLSVFHYDSFWMKEFHWCDFEWDERTFPDPAGMLKRCHERGLRVCVWINPYVAQDTAFFREGAEKGYLLLRADGKGVKQTDTWAAGMGIVDFTNPAASKWYTDKLGTLLDMGVDCFKTDFGERIPTDVRYFDGSDPKTMHNFYTYLYNKAVFELVRERKGEGEACVFARSAAAGCQQFPVHWGGDSFATYASMAETLRGGLSFAQSGFAFWSHDIAGFENTATPDLYKRWVAFGLLSSHSRLHGASSYRVPWLFGEDCSDVLRKFTRLKNTLMPYLYAHAVEAHEKGTPLMRPMAYAFPADPAAAWPDLQYMLGKSLLVAPVFNDRGLASFWLPEGKWTHLLSEEKLSGGRWVTRTFGYDSLGLYAAPNSILARGGVEDRPDYEYEKNLTLHLYEPEDGKSASCEIVTRTGEHVGTVTARREGNEVTVTLPAGLVDPKIVLHAEEALTVKRA